jgi:hypothetical protein
MFLTFPWKKRVLKIHLFWDRDHEQLTARERANLAKKKRDDVWGRDFSIFFFRNTIAARCSRFSCSLLAALQKSCTDLARSRRRSKLTSTTN